MIGPEFSGTCDVSATGALVDSGEAAATAGVGGAGIAPELAAGSCVLAAGALAAFGALPDSVDFIALGEAPVVVGPDAISGVEGAEAAEELSVPACFPSVASASGFFFFFGEGPVTATAGVLGFSGAAVSFWARSVFAAGGGCGWVLPAPGTGVEAFQFSAKDRLELNGLASTSTTPSTPGSIVTRWIFSEKVSVITAEGAERTWRPSTQK
jgi:hypothetical protein